MQLTSDSLLITTAPTEVLVTLAIFFACAGIALLLLSFEDGRYPELASWRRDWRRTRAWIRQRRAQAIAPYYAGVRYA